MPIPPEEKLERSETETPGGPPPLMPFLLITTFWSVSGGSRINWLIYQGNRFLHPSRIHPPLNPDIWVGGVSVEPITAGQGLLGGSRRSLLVAHWINPLVHLS